MSGRRKPSRYKIKFLWNVDDYRHSGLRGLRKAQVLVENIAALSRNQLEGSDTHGDGTPIAFAKFATDSTICST
jgi:hypothetical protein